MSSPRRLEMELLTARERNAKSETNQNRFPFSTFHQRTRTAGFFDMAIRAVEETEVEALVLDALFGFCCRLKRERRFWNQI